MNSSLPASGSKEFKMAELKYEPVKHDHKAFLAKAMRRPGFLHAYEALEAEYALANAMLSARTRAGLTQDAVAASMGTTKSAVSRLETGGRHAPSVASLSKYAQAVGCTLRIELVPAGATQDRPPRPRQRTHQPKALRRAA